MGRTSAKRQIQWYEQEHDTYYALANSIATTIRNILQSQNVAFVDVTCRAKTIASFKEKLRRKRYKDPLIEMTDLAGIRVVTLIERDIVAVASIIESAFLVLPEFSVDKGISLGSDRFGYRSVHLVCELGEDRAALPESKNFAGRRFEIQIRTALQHAWAEIEHDRNYKFGGELPSELKRRFLLVAGLLELADREFSSLTEEIERYETVVHDKTKSGNLDIELNSKSVTEFLRVAIAKVADPHTLAEMDNLSAESIDELRRFGIQTLSDLQELINDRFLRADGLRIVNGMGLVRDAMMYEDIDRYFNTAWHRDWTGMDEETLEFLSAKYGREKMGKVVTEKDLIMEDEDEDEDEDSGG